MRVFPFEDLGLEIERVAMLVTSDDQRRVFDDFLGVLLIDHWICRSGVSPVKRTPATEAVALQFRILHSRTINRRRPCALR